MLTELIPTILLITALRSVMIPVVFEIIRHTINSNYSKPLCLLKLVYTTALEHFKAHPFYSGLKNFVTNREEDCKLQEFVKMQFENSEYKIFTYILIMWGVGALYYAWQQNVLTEIFSVHYAISQFMSTYFLGVGFMSHAHFAQDILYFCGNIMHHCETKSFYSKSNASLVAAMPQGFALSSLLTLFWGLLIQIAIISHSPLLKKFMPTALLPLMHWVSIVFILYKVKADHPRMHVIAKPETLNSMKFWTFEWRAARHVFVHHVTGDSFGPSILFDPFYSWALYTYAYLHNTLFQLIPGQWNHYLLAISFDTLLGIILSCIVAAFWYGTEAVHRFLTESIAVK